VKQIPQKRLKKIALTSQENENLVSLSIIIPTFNAADTLEPTVNALNCTKQTGILLDLVIVDSQSTDNTVQIAKNLGANVIICKKGRGPQLIAGAKVAKSEWFLFLHADTVLESGWDASLVVFALQKNNLNRAAVFTFGLDDVNPKARLLEKLVGWRNKWLGLPYGDQGLLINRHFYKQLGGYKAWPVMEDVDFVRRIGMSQIVLFDVKAQTSAQRYIKDGYFKRVSRNFICISLYFLHIPPKWIARVYDKKNK
jgi:rSAM/selenodomain-associated transferase 2